MAYYFYLDKVLIPIPPKKLTLKVNNKNKTMDLLGIGEINIIKPAGLTDIDFEFSIPHKKLPFATYKDGFKNAKYFLDEIEKLKTNNKPFQFIVSRFTNSGEVLFHTNLKVSLEDYSILEDAEDASDITVSIKLKQYKDYVSKKIVMVRPAQAVVQNPRPPSTVKPKKKTHIVKRGESLWEICQKDLGNGSLYKKIYLLNKTLIDSYNRKYKTTKYKYTIYPHQELILE